MGADPGDRQHAGVDADLHHGAVQGQDLLGLAEVVGDGGGDVGEFLDLLLLPDEALDHPDAMDVLLNGVEPVELDSQGRLLISKRKLQYAFIESDVRFLAMVDRIEIWSKQALEELKAQNENLGQELENMFGQLDERPS